MAPKHSRKQMVFLLAVVVTLFSFQVPAISHAGQTNPVDRTVQHLLDYVARSELTFIRNSGKYTAKEASEHMQKKYKHFRDEIGTPEMFIELCATRSLLSGKPYLVINKQGEKARTSDWLTIELDNYRK